MGAVVDPNRCARHAIPLKMEVAHHFLVTSQSPQAGWGWENPLRLAQDLVTLTSPPAAGSPQG
jgi:hypothetical protein